MIHHMEELNMENFIRQHLNELDNRNKEIEIITQELIKRFSEANDEEKQEIVELLNLSDQDALSNYPELQEIREWINSQN